MRPPAWVTFCGLLAITAWAAWTLEAGYGVPWPWAAGLAVAALIGFLTAVEVHRVLERRVEQRRRARARVDTALRIGEEWRRLGAWVRYEQREIGIYVLATRECPPGARVVGEARVWMWKGTAMTRVRERAWLADRRRELAC